MSGAIWACNSSFFVLNSSLFTHWCGLKTPIRLCKWLICSWSFALWPFTSLHSALDTVSLGRLCGLVGGRRLIVQWRQMANVLPIQCVVGVLVKSFCANQNGNIFLSNKKAHDKMQDAIFKCNEFSLCALAISNAHRQNFVSKCNSKNRRQTAHACVWQPPWASQQPIFCDPNHCCF